MERVLVTGASGFIGSHLVDHLRVRDLEVLAVAGRGAVPARPGVKVLAGRDLGPDTDWTDALAGVAVVVHVAGLAHGRNGDDPVAMHRVNVEGSLRLAAAARDAGVRRLVFLSSIGVHGSLGGPVPITEASPLWLDGPYAESKAEAERRLAELLDGTATELVVVRPPLVYGRNAPGNPARLVRLVRSGLPLPFGAIDNRRSFLSVGNLCAALHACIVDSRAAGETFVVADRETTSTPDLLRSIARRLRRPARLFAFPRGLLRALLVPLGRAGDLDRLTADFVVDARHLEERLDFAPPETLDEGLDAWLGAAP